jgi:hypothetical protein
MDFCDLRIVLEAAHRGGVADMGDICTIGPGLEEVAIAVGNFVGPARS